MLIIPSASPVGLSGFDLAGSIWSRDSDLTLDELALSYDSTSNHSRSSMSSHWSAPPLTPSTSRHSDLRPPLDLSVETPVQELDHEEPESPAPAYSRDPLECDPALLASLDPLLRLRPFEAFEDVCWASFSDVTPSDVELSSQSQSASLSHDHPSMSCTSFTTNSDTSTTITFAPPLPSLSPSSVPPPSPSQPPPAYPTSKPLPSLPPPSPIRLTAEHTQPSLSHNPSHNPPVVMTFKSPIVAMDNSSILAATPVETVQFFPLRLQARPLSKSGSGGAPKTVQRLTTAIARLRGRE